MVKKSVIGPSRDETEAKRQLLLPQPPVAVGAAGMSLASQRPQKHAVGSVNHVGRRMSQMLHHQRGTASQAKTMS